MDEDLCFTDHIKAATKPAFWYLRNKAKLRNHVSQEEPQIIIYAFVSSRVDSCNTLLVG